MQLWSMSLLILHTKYHNSIPWVLTLSQMTNFQLFKTERVCRQQFQIQWKWQNVMSNFSFSHCVFKRLALHTRKSQGLFGKGFRVRFNNATQKISKLVALWFYSTSHKHYFEVYCQKLAVHLILATYKISKLIAIVSLQYTSFMHHTKYQSYLLHIC